MNLERLERLVGAGAVSTSFEDMIVYGRDASHLEGECLAVVWPSQPEQVAALVEWACAEHVDLVARGAGTGLCGGATPQHSIVVDLSRLTAIGPLDVERASVTVGAGVPLATLNRHVAPQHYFLPVIPGSQRAASIGGMIATDAAGLHAVHYGSMRRWVDEVTLVTGMGRVERIAGDRLGDVVGREGATGMIVAATVRLAPLPALRTVSLRAFADESDLLVQRDRWLVRNDVTALEYLNRHAARAIGWEPRPHLLVEFDAPSGEIADPGRIAALWRARDGLYPVLARDGHAVIEDPQLIGDGLGKMLAWLDGAGVPTFGHLGIGIVHPCFSPGDDRARSLYDHVASWGGRVSGEHGIGIKKRQWTTTSFRDEIHSLKQLYDPQGIINRGKLC